MKLAASNTGANEEAMEGVGCFVCSSEAWEGFAVVEGENEGWTDQIYLGREGVCAQTEDSSDKQICS